MRSSRRRKPSQADAGLDRREAVFYVRVSSKEQEEGFSIPAQIDAARAYALANGLKLVGEFADVESAKKSGRRQFQEMCRFLRKSKTCRIVIVEKTDRLYRNLKDWVALDDLMQEQDLVVHLYKENTVLTRDARSHEKFIHGIKVLMAKNYVDNLAEEVKKGLNEKARQGHYPMRAPVGYLNNPVTRHIDVDPEKAPIVRRLFELYGAGNHSLADLLKVAREEGLMAGRSASGTTTKASVHKMLTNPLYYGWFRWKDRLIQGNHTPLISKELFDKVQAIMEGRWGGTYVDRSFAFTGLITCGHCGCAVTAEIKKGKYVYYHCTGNKGQCERKYVREEAIAEQLGQVLQALQLDERLAETLRLALKESQRDEEAYHQQMVSSLQTKETTIVNRLRKLYVDKLDGTIDGEIYAQLKAEWDGELITVREKLAAHQEADRKYMELGIRLFELAQTAYSSYMRRSPHEKRQILNFVLSNCHLRDGKVVPVYRKPFDLIASTGSQYEREKGPDGVHPDPCLLKWR